MNLSIAEIRSITKIVNDYLNVDLSNFGSVSLKSRLRNIMGVFEIRSADNFISFIQSGKISLDEFLSSFSVPYTEMFRDPSMWRKLKGELQTIKADIRPFKIYIPSCTNGDEYYSLLILLEELNIVDKVKITVSSWSDKSLAQIKSVNILPKKMELNKANYKRFEGKDGLNKYFENSKLNILQYNTEFVKINLFEDKTPSNQDLIIFRNKLIYFTEKAQNNVVESLYDSLKVGGKLIIGVKENIYLNNSIKDKFLEICDVDRIYKKK